VSRERVTLLAQQLRKAAHEQDPAAKAAIELVKLQCDLLKESLVKADGDDMLRAQGAARAYEKLHTEMTTEPPSFARQEKQR
jgi:hypothetical protein